MIKSLFVLADIVVSSVSILSWIAQYWHLFFLWIGANNSSLAGMGALCTIGWWILRVARWAYNKYKKPKK